MIPYQNIFVNQNWHKCEQKQAQGSVLNNSALSQALGEAASCSRVPLLQFCSHWHPEFQRPAAPTMQPKDILQVGEDFPLVTGAEDALPGDPLVEDVVQDLQRAHVGSLRVEQLWGDRESRIAAVEPGRSLEQVPQQHFPPWPIFQALL